MRLACIIIIIIIRTHNKDMECNDSVRADTGFISRLLIYTVHMCRWQRCGSWGDWRTQCVCVAATTVSPVTAQSCSQQPLYTQKMKRKKNLKTEILLGDICTVLEDIKNYWRPVLQFFNTIWCVHFNSYDALHSWPWLSASYSQALFSVLLGWDGMVIQHWWVIEQNWI